MLIGKKNWEVNVVPNIKSAIKRVKVTKTKNLHNRMIKSQVKTAFKKFDAAIEAKDMETAKTAYSQAVSAIDKAACKGVYHKNTASRNKARMAARMNKIAAL